jgi:hypothetical protein
VLGNAATVLRASYGVFFDRPTDEDLRGNNQQLLNIDLYSANKPDVLYARPLADNLPRLGSDPEALVPREQPPRQDSRLLYVSHIERRGSICSGKCVRKTWKESLRS